MLENDPDLQSERLESDFGSVQSSQNEIDNLDTPHIVERLLLLGMKEAAELLQTMPGSPR